MSSSIENGVRAAIKAAGGARALGRLLNVSHQAVSQWKKVPAERMLEIERATGVSRTILRPDLFQGMVNRKRA